MSVTHLYAIFICNLKFLIGRNRDAFIITLGFEHITSNRNQTREIKKNTHAHTQSHTLTTAQMHENLWPFWLILFEVKNLFTMHRCIFLLHCFHNAIQTHTLTFAHTANVEMDANFNAHTKL